MNHLFIQFSIVFMQHIAICLAFFYNDRCHTSGGVQLGSIKWVVQISCDLLANILPFFLLSRGLSSPLFFQLGNFTLRTYSSRSQHHTYWKFMIWIFYILCCVLKEFLMGSCRCINYCLDNTANMMRKVHATINYAWTLLLTLCML